MKKLNPTGVLSSHGITSEVTMTKREAFAMAAMQGICSSGPMISNLDIAVESIKLADDLLAELEK